MADSQRIEEVSERLAALEDEFRTYAAGRQRIFGDVEELFREMAKAMDVVAASLEDLTPAEEHLGGMEDTGVMGRAFELQALVGMFRANLEELHRRLAAMR